jgi:hypothetical protein
MASIDEKFNKYIRNISKSGSSGCIKPVLKQKEQNHVYEQYRGSRAET